MPFYEYQCEACGHKLEALQKMSDDPLVFCPECNEAKLKKLISAAAFRLKGTGWYETDFKDNSKKKEQKKSTSEGTVRGEKIPVGDGNSATKTETKPSTKPTSAT